MDQGPQLTRQVVVKTRTGGFTLIEVLIVVVIVAILAGVALPSYLDSVRKSRRSDAINSLSKAQQAQERYRANNATYGDSFVNVSAPNFGIGTGATATFDGADGYYTIDITFNNTTNYTLLAFAKAGTSQAKDKGCQCLQLAMEGGNVTYSAGGPTSGTFNGTAAGCGAIAAGATANRCWRR